MSNSRTSANSKPKCQQETDWETSGDEQYEKSRSEFCDERPPVSIIDLRDQVQSIRSLLQVCLMALHGRESLQPHQIANVIADFIDPELKQLDQELNRLWNPQK